MKGKKWLAGVGVLLTLSLGLSACGGDASREDAGDAPASAVDKSQPGVMAFNNHYPNVENKCDGHGHRVFVSTHDSSTGQNVTVLPDPSCPGYVRGSEPPVVAAP